MKTFKTLCLLGILVAFNACGDPKSKGKLEHPVQVISLNESDILDVSKVKKYLATNANPTKESGDLFLKGIDAVKNKKMVDSAIFYLEKSISSYPTANAYYELGQLYREKKKLDDAQIAFQLAESMDYAPYANILYQQAIIYSQKEEFDNAAKFIELAIQAGFSELNKLANDPLISKLRDEWIFFLNF